MSSSYKFNFQDLSRFMDDFFYLLKKGGRAQKLLSSPAEKKSFVERFIGFVVVFLKLVLILVLLYTIYILLFRGYPRIPMNVVTFSFFHKEKLDDFIKERNLLINHLKFIAGRFAGACADPYSVYNRLYGGTNLYSACKNFENAINKTYPKEKYDDKYHTALKEYYVFYSTLLDSKTDDVVFNDKSMRIPNYPFYEMLGTYLIDKGELARNNSKGVEKGQDELMQEVYRTRKSYRNNLIEIRRAIDSMAGEVNAIVNNFANLPITSYIMIPPDDKAAANVQKDFTNYKKEIQNNTVHKSIPYLKISDFGWCMIEYIVSKKNPSQYQLFASQIPPYTNEDVNAIIYYLNLPRAQKNVAEQRIMNSKNHEFLEYIKKRPLFAHIYFAQQNIGDKQTLYSRVMDAYSVLCDCGGVKNNIEPSTMTIRINNLKVNGYFYKQFMTSAAFLHMYLNVYREGLGQMYNKQIISAKRFFDELWSPFVDDILKNRVGNMFKKTFSATGFKKSWANFIKWHKWLGKELKTLITAVFKAFFTKVPVEKPQPTETEPSDSQQNE